LICIRNSLAGIEMGAALAHMDGDPAPKIATPTTRKVKRTFQSHPLAQCRLDTYFQGALCNVDPRVEPSNTDPYHGVCSAGSDVGTRPRCWFKP
jgi:hypothetical protein